MAVQHRASLEPGSPPRACDIYYCVYVLAKDGQTVTLSHKLTIGHPLRLALTCTGQLPALEGCYNMLYQARHV